MINKSPVITNEGLSLLSRAVSDAYKVVFTRCELGDGVYSGDPKEATSLVSPKETTSNTSSSATIGQIKLSSLLNCSTITADFVCREYGVYAVLKKVTLGQNITEGSEVLFAYACDEVGGMIRKTSPSVNMYYNIDLTMQISDSVITEIVTNDVELFASKTVFEGHTANIDNPHRVTKEQIGLGNVPNVSTNEQTPTYQVSPDLQLLASGERLAYTLSKTAKAVQELKQHLEAENPHNLTADDIGAVSVEEVNARLPKSGGEMTGHLTMSLNRYLVFESGASDGSCFVFHSVDGQFFVHKMANGQVMETPLRITAEGEVFINNVEVNGQGGGLMVVIDEFLSEESQNPVANSAITSALLALQTMITDKVNADDVLEVIAPVLANYANSSHSHTLDEVSETTSKKIMTATERTKLSGIAEGANKTVVDNSMSTTSTNPVQNKVVNTALSNKVDKESGKGLSTNDYTTAEKTKLSGIAEGANKTTVDTALSTTSTNPVQNKVIKAAFDAVNTGLSGKADTGHTHSDYATKTELNGKANSTHTHSEYATTTALNSALSGKADVGHTHTDYAATGHTHTASEISGLQNITVDTALSSSSTNPVQNKAVNTALANKVDKVSGKGLSTNDFTSTLKTKLEGVEAGANKTVVDTALSATSTNPVQNKVINTALNGKAEAIHPHNMADIADLPQIVTHGATGEWSNTGSADTFLATTSYVDGRAEDYVLYVASNRFCTHDNPDQLVAKFNETATGLSNILVLKAEQTDLYTQYKQFICTSKTSPNFQFGHLYEISYDEEADEFTISDVNPEFSLVETASGGEGASITVDDALSNTSTNPVQNKIVKAALDSKSDSSHTHSNYAASDHTHSGYATTTALSNMLPKSGGTMTGALEMGTNKNIKLKCGDKAYYYALHADSSGILYLHKMSSSNAVLDTVFKMYSTGVVEFHGVNVNDLQNRVTALETQLAGLETLLGNLL